MSSLRDLPYDVFRNFFPVIKVMKRHKDWPALKDLRSCVHHVSIGKAGPPSPDVQVVPDDVLDFH
jgi:hypothetical protein